MELRETRPGEFLWQWGASGSRPIADELTPRGPTAACRRRTSCVAAKRPAAASLSIDGVGERYSAALVKVFWRDGQSRVYTLTERQPTVHLYGSADDRRGMGEIARAYLVLGVEHILSGIDHLLFVAALLFLVGFQRRLVWTITAFTLAHSLTLAQRRARLADAALGAGRSDDRAVHRAGGRRSAESRARRWRGACPPWSRSCSASMHGLGFAGALSEIGLPQNHLATALLTFNVGVEIGQLMAVAWPGPRGAWSGTGASRSEPRAAAVRHRLDGRVLVVAAHRGDDSMKGLP